MAIISKILSLPSATQYNPTGFPSFAIYTGFTFGTPIRYGQVANGGTPTNEVGWQEPNQSFFKNKSSSRYRFRLTRVSDDALIRDDLLGSIVGEGELLQSSMVSLGSGLVAGTLYRVQLYTTANSGGVLYNPNVTGFVAQTAPNISPTQTGGWTIGGYAESPSGNVMSVTLNSHTTDWGGVGTSTLGRYYSLELVKTDGAVYTSGILYKQGSGGTVNAAYSSENPIIAEVNLGSILNGDYRVFVKAANQAGEATRIENPTTALYGAQNFPPIKPPTLTSISPTSGPGSGGTPVTITGTSLTTVTSAQIGGENIDIRSRNYTTIYGITDDKISSTPQTYNLTVSNPAGNATLLQAFSYSAYAGPPPPPGGNKRCTTFDLNTGQCFQSNCCCSPGFGQFCSGSSCSGNTCAF